MTVDLFNEPYDKLHGILIGSSSLVAAAPGLILRGKPATQDPRFPMIRWNVMSVGSGKSDAESWLGRVEQIKIDVIGPKDDVLLPLAFAIDELLGPAASAGNLNSTHWKVGSLYRVSDWQLVELAGEFSVAGNAVWLRTSEWQMRANRKQDI